MLKELKTLLKENISYNGKRKLKGSSHEKTTSCGVKILEKNLINFLKRKMMKTVVF